MITLAALQADLPLVRFDRFPVRVAPLVDGETGEWWRECRAMLTAPSRTWPDPLLLVWRRAGDPAVAAVVDDAGSEVAGPRVDWTVATEAGVWVVRGQGGCGCGSPLKRGPGFPVRLVAARR